jgi:hypothetical protein
MPDPITVTEAVHFAKIAADAGFYDWKTLWDKNGALSGTRANPLLLFHGDRKDPKNPGDTVEVPELERKEESKAADNDAPYQFRVKRSKIFLRLRVLDENFKPLPETARWRVIVDGVHYPTEGPAPFEADGRINVEVNPSATVGRLTVTYPAPVYNPQPTGPAPERKPIEVNFKLSVGRLDPIQENAPDADCWAGVQQRLNNMSFYAGEVDGKEKEVTKQAIRQFQRRMTPGTVDGLPATVMAKLHELHDTPAAIPDPPPP